MIEEPHLLWFKLLGVDFTRVFEQFNELWIPNLILVQFLTEQ